MSFDNLSMASQILTPGKQQASKSRGEFGSWVLLSPAEGVISSSMHCFSMLVLTCLIGSVGPVVSSSGTCLSSQKVLFEKTFYIFFQLISPLTPQMRGEMLFCCHRSPGCLILQVAVLPVFVSCFWSSHSVCSTRLQYLPFQCCCQHPAAFLLI